VCGHGEETVEENFWFPSVGPTGISSGEEKSMKPTKVDALLGSLLEWIFLLHYSLETLYDIIDFPFTCDSGGLMIRLPLNP
jgi:hypothetical protein